MKNIGFLAKIVQSVEKGLNWLNQLGNQSIDYPFPIKDRSKGVQNILFLLEWLFS